MVKNALTGFLARIDEQTVLDEAILEYVVGVLEALGEDDAEAQEDISGLHDVLEEASPAFRSLTHEQRSHALLWLWGQVSSSQCSGATCCRNWALWVSRAMRGS
jgi:hypothetical protein